MRPSSLSVKRALRTVAVNAKCPIDAAEQGLKLLSEEAERVSARLLAHETVEAHERRSLQSRHERLR